MRVQFISLLLFKYCFSVFFSKKLFEPFYCWQGWQVSLRLPFYTSPWLLRNQYHFLLMVKSNLHRKCERIVLNFVFFTLILCAQFFFFRTIMRTRKCHFFCCFRSYPHFRLLLTLDWYFIRTFIEVMFVYPFLCFQSTFSRKKTQFLTKNKPLSFSGHWQPTHTFKKTTSTTTSPLKKCV